MMPLAQIEPLKAKHVLPAAGKDRPLNSRHRRFVSEYLVDLNATQAAIRSGYSHRGADVAGVRLLANPKVAAALRSAQARRCEGTAITADRVLRELANIAFADIRRLFNNQGELLCPREFPADIASAIASIHVVASSTGTGRVKRVIRIRMCDKLTALNLLAKHLKLLVSDSAQLDDTFTLSQIDSQLESLGVDDLRRIRAIVALT